MKTEVQGKMAYVLSEIKKSVFNPLSTGHLEGSRSLPYPIAIASLCGCASPLGQSEFGVLGSFLAS